ncbi:hypothetical protein ACNQVK_01130 [Mycobacterium sp. 134]|uniref:hypothetical protein n=1 Tax=Mycobacterium sp. 134 TaxID=3400425 RepID=UPI003AACA230
MSWDTGRANITAALTAGELQRITGAQAAGAGWVADARTKLATAENIAQSDPATAYVTAYDAARFALVAILAQQGLRATQRGGHLAVEHAAKAQFGRRFATFAVLRRRRAELEYPAYAGERVEVSEAHAAIADSGAIVDAAEALLAHLTIFA